MTFIESARDMLVRRTADLVANPVTLGVWLYICEAILADLEFSLIAFKQLIEIEDDKVLIGQLENSIFHRAFGWVNFQHSLPTLNNTAIVWMILLVALMILVWIIHSIFLKKKPPRQQIALRREEDGTIIPRTRSFLKYTIYLYGYLFYIVGIFSVTFFLCKTNITDQTVTQKFEDLPLLSTGADVLAEKNALVKDLVWIFDDTKKCFGGDYFIMAIFGLLVFILNAVLMVYHCKVTGFYPSPLVSDGKRNYLVIVLPVVFIVLNIIGQNVVAFRSTDYINFYYICVIIGYGMLLLIVIFGKPFYNTTLQKIKILKCIIIICLSGWMYVLRSNPSLRVEMFKREYDFIVGIALLSTFLLKVFDMATSFKPGGAISEAVWDPKQSQISLSTASNLVYQYELLKFAMCEKQVNLLENQETLNIILEFQCVFARHIRGCTKDDCFCKSRTWNLKATRQDKLVESSGQQLLPELLFIMNKILNNKLEQLTLDENVFKPELLDFLPIWICFAMSNFGQTARVMSLIHKLESQLVLKASRASGKFKKKQTLPFTLEVLKVMVLDKVKGVNESPFNNRWNYILASGHPSDQKEKISLLELSSVIRFINSLNLILGKIDEIIITKRIILEQFAANQKKLMKPSIKYNLQREEIEKIFQKLQISGHNVFYKAALIQIFYHQQIKEDYSTSQALLTRVALSSLNENFGDLLSSELGSSSTSKWVVVNICGEPSKLHEIIHVTKNIEDLQYRLIDVVGKDLKILLPNCVSVFHRNLMHPTQTTTLHLHRREALAMAVREENGYIRKAEIIYRVNSKLTRGLEYVGFIKFKSRESEKIIMMVDSNGIIRDINGIASSAFRINTPLSSYNEEMDQFIVNYNTGVMVKEFGLKPEEGTDEQEWKTYYDIADQILNKWMPVWMCLAAGGVSFNAKMSAYKVFSSKEVLFFIEMVSLDVDEDAMKEKDVIGAMKVHNEKKANYSVKDWKLQPISEAEFGLKDEPKSMNSSIYDINLKHAQQMSEFPVTSSPSNFMNSPDGKGRVRTNTFSRFKIKEIFNSPTRTFHASQLMTEIVKFVAEQKVQRQEEANETFLKFFELIGPNKSTYRHSRFIHHTVNFKGITRKTFLFSLPLVLLILSIIWAAISETNFFGKFPGITNDILITDAGAYITWVCNLHMQYVEIQRMNIEGVFSDQQFAKWGFINSTKEHMRWVANSDQYIGQLPVHILRRDRMYYKSNFTEYYNADELHRDTYDALFYDDAHGTWSWLRMKLIDVARYTQLYMDKLLTTEEQYDYSLGPDLNRRREPHEEAVRFNAMNPINHHNIFTTDMIFEAQENILQGLILSYSLPLIISGLGSISLLIFYSGILYCLHSRLGSLATRMYNFPVELVNEELARFDKSVGNYKHFLKHDSLDFIDNSVAKSRSMYVKTAVINPQGYKSKNKGFTATTRKSGHDVSLKEAPMIFGIFILLTFITIGCLLRYFVIADLATPYIYLVRACHTGTQLYYSTLGTNMALLEMVIFDNTTTINYMPPEDHFGMLRKRMQTKVVDKMNELANMNIGEASDIYRGLADTKMCDILLAAAPLPGLYANCDIALSGIATYPVRKFLHQYLNLAGQLFEEWKRTPSKADRYKLFDKDQYSSILAFAVMEPLGTGDAMYYHFLIPLFTKLYKILPDIAPKVNLTNIISMAAVVVAIALSSYFIVKRFNALQRAYWYVLYCVPIRLIENNAHLLQRIKLARARNNFAYL